jgi:ABC-type multidrug transport system fused ATPase/permease subunit
VSILVLFFGYFRMIERATLEISDITNDIIIAKIGIQRMVSILHEEPTIEGKGKGLAYPSAWKQLEVRNVHFAYEHKAVLKDVSLTLNRGEKVGVVGLSGAGKSTFFNLLLDLHEEYTGEILLGGVSLKDIDRTAYIDHVSVVLQETELFNASLRDNITMAAVGEQELSEEHLQEVLRIAHLSSLLEKLPEGLESVVGEKGVKLSGGEKQRVGIARALYRKPDLLLLDEATSHLDVESEKLIQEALHDVFQKVTAVVIAHRLSTIREMDRIVVLDGGRIVEQGSFEQLLTRGGKFASLWKKQSGDTVAV